eukprot:TRINITY_DN31905_c0_g1_i2.p1 TRINITY_DN31905_c0_g1~~TRINITY_DN31905_c0_g1_i2.p1  ORF type:complete len:371 (+),score=30.63 TRINITY_DN31905_c0_g1_i2:92-1204(+)
MRIRVLVGIHVVAVLCSCAWSYPRGGDRWNLQNRRQAFQYSILEKTHELRRPQSWDALLRNARNTTASLPPYLWMYWEQGDVQRTAPPLDRMSLDEFIVQNPTRDLRIMTQEDVFVLFPEMKTMFERKPRTIGERSKLVGLSLLAKFGGVWAETSVLPLSRLDSFAGQAVAPAGFFGFVSKTDVIASPFLISMPGNAMVVAWRKSYHDQWFDKQEFIEVEEERVFKEMIATGNDRVLDVWKKMPRVPSVWPSMCETGCEDMWISDAVNDLPPVLLRAYRSAGRTLPACLMLMPEREPRRSWVLRYQASLDFMPRPNYSKWFSPEPLHMFCTWILPFVVSVVITTLVLQVACMGKSHKKYSSLRKLTVQRC